MPKAKILLVDEAHERLPKHERVISANKHTITFFKA